MRKLDGQKLYLREITEDDTDLILRWRNSDFVRANFIHQPLITREEHLLWFREKVQKGLVIQYLMVEKATGKKIGSVYLRDVDYQTGKAEYGIFLGEESVCGKGYGTEAAELMLSFSRNDLGLHKVSLRVLENNVRAIKSYEKAGFHMEGKMVDEVLSNGQYQNLIFMAVIFREEK